MYIKSILYETRLEIDYALLHKKSSLPSLLFYGKKDYYLCFYQEGRNNISMPKRNVRQDMLMLSSTIFTHI